MQGAAVRLFSWLARLLAWVPPARGVSLWVRGNLCSGLAVSEDIIAQAGSQPIQRWDVEGREEVGGPCLGLGSQGICDKGRGLLPDTCWVLQLQPGLAVGSGVF